MIGGRQWKLCPELREISMSGAFTSRSAAFRFIVCTLAAVGLLIVAPVLVSAQARPADLALRGASMNAPAGANLAQRLLAFAMPRIRNASASYSTVTITTTSLANGKVGQAYSARIESTAGVTPYTWTVVDGSLPGGLTLESTSGVIAGTPAAYGISDFVIVVTDSHVPPYQDYKRLSIQINPAEFAILTAGLPEAIKDTAFAATLVAGGGTEPYAWSLAGGALPAGLSLESTDVIVGTPTATGTSGFTVRAVDSAPVTATQPLSLVVVASPLAITTASLPHAVAVVPYSHTLAATGGVPPYAWKILAGSLPPGITLESTSGTISGSTRGVGHWGFVMQVSDSKSPAAKDSDIISLTVDANPDNQGPTIPLTSISIQPRIIRHGIENSLTLTATADDSARGASTVTAAEYFVPINSTDTDPGYGHGTPMNAADGSFDSTAEVITATVDTSSSSWTTDKRIYFRAQDYIGNWSSTYYVTVHCTTDVTPPGRVVDLSADAKGTLAAYTASSHDFSSAGPTTPTTNLFDRSNTTYWQTLGTTVPETEYLTLDLTTVKTVAALILAPESSLKLFPNELTGEASEDGIAWIRIFALKPPRKTALEYWWQFEPVDARYIKISGPGVKGPDRHYYWRIATAMVCQTGGPMIQLTFTAPGNDAYDAGSRATEYDVRYSTAMITEDNFLSCPRAYGLGAPKLPGQGEQGRVRVDSTDTEIYIALKTVDDVGNWSPLSNVVPVKPEFSGFVSLSPDDAEQGDATAQPTFEFRQDPAAASVHMDFSSSLDFFPKPTMGSNGVVNASAKFPVKSTATSWTPTPSQWKPIKTVVPPDRALFWRLEGLLGKAVVVYGPARTILFESNDITGLAVDPSHKKGADDAVWPDKAAPITFSWTNVAPDMVSFYVDVSTDAAIPVTNKKKTIALTVTDPAKVSKLLSTAEWKKLRKLATAGGGTLYWRVRAKDAQKALTIVSAAKKLIVDPGSWALGDLSLNSMAPAVSWPYTGQGMVTTSLQFSVLPDFSGNASKTLKVPAASTSATSRSFTAKEVTRIKALATRNGATTLYYRVRGEDGDKAFIAYSDAKTLTP